MVTKIELFESPDPTPLHFCLWGWVKREVYKRKVNTWDELLTTRTKKHENQFKWTTRDLCT